ncbi:MAG TPA: alpha-E domain-containing protein [Chthoniobacteraceae bacterium]|jgi:uncharacterized alpha-E superfamily protein|nr:alpha-E domain-containing protein [Chthoniobacteraceae bacterium]
MLSRVADTLYWLGRYIERAENNARILDVNLQVTLDSDESAPDAELYAWQPILATLEDVKVFKSVYEAINGDTVCDFVTFEKNNPNSIWSCVAAARENARTVREYISSEMWERINSLYLWLKSEPSRDLVGSAGIDFYRHVVDQCHQFHGTTDQTLMHADGWDFLQVGKFIERGDSASRILDLKYHILLPQEEEVGGTVDIVQWQAVLRSCSALEAYRKFYTGPVTPWSVAEFVILNDRFPRSIRFSVDALDTAIHRISGCDRAHYSNEAERLSGRLCAELTYVTTAEIFRTGMHEYLDAIQTRLNEIGNAMHRQYCEWMEPAPVSQSQSQG